MSDPAIGRFWQVDPLATDYVYNSPYAFQENKLGLGVELEGLELRTFTNKDGTRGLNVHFKVLNSSSFLSANGGDKKAEEIAQSIADRTEASFPGKDADGNDVSVNVTFEMVDSVDRDNDFFVELVDIVKNEDGSMIKDEIPQGKVRDIGNPESNRIQIGVLTVFDSDNKEAGRTGTHELLHTGGLTHSTANGDRSNIMIRGDKASPNSINISPSQRSTVLESATLKPVSHLIPAGLTNLNQ